MSGKKKYYYIDDDSKSFNDKINDLTQKASNKKDKVVIQKNKKSKNTRNKYKKETSSKKRISNNVKEKKIISKKYENVKKNKTSVDVLDTPILKKKKKKSVDVLDTFVLRKKKNKGRKNNKKLFMFVLGILIVSSFSIGGLILKKIYDKHLIETLSEKRKQMVEEISSHYNKYVLVNRDSKLYRLSDQEEYEEYGMVYKNTELSLSDIEITYSTKYFYSSDLDAYIEFSNVSPIEELTKYDDRYKKYIVFNENIVTSDMFTLYDNSHEVYAFNESMTFPIIVRNDDGKYYVEFNNRLLYIKKDDIKEIKSVSNTNVKNASKITTLCYHRVYDTNEKCNDKYICKKKSTFAKEMGYLHDNNYLSLTMEEVYWYLKGMIQVPRKSVVITLDDGYLIKSAIDVLEKYQVHATSFIKTVDFVNNLSVFDSPFLEKQSHTHRLHVAYVCKKEKSYQYGGAILCYSKEVILNDLKLSRNTLNGAIAMAFPFYDYNQRALSLVKEAGFKLAFVGSNGVVGRAKPGINLYEIPRITVWDTTSFNTFIGYVTN